LRIGTKKKAMSRRLYALMGLFGAVLGSVGVQAADRVSIPGSGVNLASLLFTPAGIGPFPAVIGLHGCGGLYASDGTLSARHADWAERLAALGFIVLLPDSFGSRGIGSQCNTSDRVARASSERVSDAIAARAYLQSRSDVKPRAVSLLGWSNGGSTVLFAVQKGEEPPGGGADFAKAVAFYPGCRSPAERGWHARLPLMILIGAADDWTPAAPCEALAASAKAVGEPVSIIIYPGAYHDFDYPNLPVHTRSGLAYTADRSGIAHTGTNAEARTDALRRVTAFLLE
jgi:dienelactone hydrolase